MKKLFLIFSVAFILLIAGCTSAIKSPTDIFIINSTELGSKVYINGHYSGETPLIANLAMFKDYEIKIESETHGTLTEKLSKNITGWSMGNTKLGRIIGIEAEAATGHVYVFVRDGIEGHDNVKRGTMIRNK